MSALALIVTRLSGALGAELSGLDLSQPLRPHDLAALRSAWLEHGVVFLRDQQVTYLAGDQPARDQVLHCARH